MLKCYKEETWDAITRSRGHVRHQGRTSSLQKRRHEHKQNNRQREWCQREIKGGEGERTETITGARTVRDRRGKQRGSQITDRKAS